MTKEEFLKLSDDEKIKFLNSEVEAGKDFNKICAELGMTKLEFSKIGIYFVGNKFMGKPMKGYQITQRSGNEKPL